MAPKRKRAPSKPPSTKAVQPQKKIRERTIRTSNPKQNASRGFLALPAEIKNAIYEVWAEGETVYIRPRGLDLFTSTHPAASLCRQTRDEFIDLLAKDSTFTAPKIIAQVHDFNFNNITQVMKLVDADERADITDFTHENGRGLSVQLTLTETFCKDIPVNNLARWFRWTDTLERPLVIEYSLRSVAEPQKALEIFERFATGHGRSEFVGDVLTLLQSYVECMKEAPEVEDEDEAANRRMAFNMRLMEEVDDLL